ncbi:MAG: ABC transporter substrate-binding protein [Dehalococcoidia bacterium]
MNTIGRFRFSAKVAKALAVMLLAVLALIALAAACGGDEEEATPTPSASPAATVTGSPSPAASPGAIGPGVTDTEIILGHYTPLTGLYGAVFKGLADALDAYFKYVNEEQNGVCGRKIVIKRYDDGSSEDGALAAARKLVEQDRVFAVVLGMFDAPVIYLNEQGVPHLLSGNVSERYAAEPLKYPWMTQGTPSFRTVAWNMAEWIMEEHPGKKVAVLWPNSDDGREGLEGLTEALDPNVNQLVANESVEATAVDIRAQMQRLKNSGAEVLALFTSISQTAQALKMASRLDWHPALPAHYGNADSILFQYAAPEEVEGLVTFHAFKMPDWTDDPAVAEHHRILAQYGGPTPGIFTIYIQVAGEIIVESLNRCCDNLTRECVMKANRSFHNWRSELLYPHPDVVLNTSETDMRFLQGGPAMHVVLVDGKPEWQVYREEPYFFYLPGEE